MRDGDLGGFSMEVAARVMGQLQAQRLKRLLDKPTHTTGTLPAPWPKLSSISPS